MRAYSVPLAVVFALTFSLASLAAEKPRPKPDNQNQPKKVWTNDDLDQLRSRGLISIAGQEPAQPATQTPAAPAETTYPVYASRLDDPEWYAEKAADLQGQLDSVAATLREQQDAIALAVDQRITNSGVDLEKDNVGVTPAAGLAILQARMQEIQSRLDELSDLARQHAIPPGVLRS